MSKIILLVNCFVLAVQRNQGKMIFEVDASADMDAFVRTQEAVEDSAMSNAFVRTQEAVEDSAVSNAFVRTQEDTRMGSREDKFCEAFAKLGQLNAGKGLPCFLTPEEPQVYMIPTCTMTTDPQGSRDLFVLKLQFEEYSKSESREEVTIRGELIVKPMKPEDGWLFREEIASMINKETAGPNLKMVKAFAKGRRWGQISFIPSSPNADGAYRKFVSLGRDNGAGTIDDMGWFTQNECSEEFVLGFHQLKDDKIIQLKLFRRTECKCESDQDCYYEYQAPWLPGQSLSDDRKAVAESNWLIPVVFWGLGADGNLQRQPRTPEDEIEDDLE